MDNLRMPALARTAIVRSKTLPLDNDAKVKLGVGCTIGSCIIAMLMMVPA